VGIGILFWIAAPIKPSRHAKPADLDPILFENDGFPCIGCVIARADEEQAFFTQVAERLIEAGVALVHHMVVRE
jgi:hypothetical protein